jgi:sporulation protein YlmC with PRC-barrel domain
MKRLTDLLSYRVSTREGKDVGRVFDVRCAGEPEHGLSRRVRLASELIYGRHGWMEFFGFKKTEGRRVAWEKIVRIERGKIIIDEQE